MRQKRFFDSDLYYHLLLKGNNQNLFLNERDFSRFMISLEKYSRKYSIRIIAFALMPNHIHLLAKQGTDEIFSKFVQVLTTAYAVYFNFYHRRSGHLFQGRFKHIAVETDEYLTHLSRYIHLNPTSSRLVAKPEDYRWSSYRAYLGLEKASFVDKEAVLSYFSSQNPTKDYQEFVESRIDYQKNISYQKLILE